ncbi:MAG: CcmD family protein [Saprospiraceae bacterium]
MQHLNAALFLQAAPDFIRSIGKIYVVVAVIVIVLLGLFAYLYFVDRRLTNLEEQIQDDE